MNKRSEPLPFGGGDPQLLLKITPPRIPRTVLERGRLSSQRVEFADKSVVAIQATAGSGKTSLLAQWRKEALQTGAVVAWLTLDSLDDDGRFIAALTHAMRASSGRSNFGQSWIWDTPCFAKQIGATRAQWAVMKKSRISTENYPLFGLDLPRCVVIAGQRAAGCTLNGGHDDFGSAGRPAVVLAALVLQAVAGLDHVDGSQAGGEGVVHHPLFDCLVVAVIEARDILGQQDVAGLMLVASNV